MHLPLTFPELGLIIYLLSGRDYSLHFKLYTHIYNVATNNNTLNYQDTYTVPLVLAFLAGGKLQRKQLKDWTLYFKMTKGNSAT